MVVKSAGASGTPVVGCDPGIEGALALVVGGRLALVVDMPIVVADGKTRLGFDADGMPEERHGVVRTVDPVGVRAILAEWMLAFDWRLRFVIERAGPRPEQGIASTAKSMLAAGEVGGVAIGLGLERRVVAPSSWKSAMGVTADKGTSLARIRDLEPSMAALFARKKDNGRAEAALIALWGWRNL